MADGCGVNSPTDCLSARFVTGSRVVGIDCGVVAVDVPAQNWYGISYPRRSMRPVT